MTFKTLVTGVVTGTAAVAVVGAAAAGVTSLASGPSAATAVQPVVFGVPMPAAPAPELQGDLQQTLSALAAGGSFAGKAAYIQGGLGRIETVSADRAYRNAAQKGYFPLSFSISNIDKNDGIATANVTATAANGESATQQITFVAGPSPTGWQVSKSSALSLLSSAG